MIRIFALGLFIGFPVMLLFSFLFTEIDVTIIGHLKGWKKIHYPKIFSNFIPLPKYGGELLKDCNTHPQVLILITTDLLVFISYIAFFIWAILRAINAMDTWVICLIVAISYSSLIIRIILLHRLRIVCLKKAGFLPNKNNSNINHK